MIRARSVTVARLLAVCTGAALGCAAACGPAREEGSNNGRGIAAYPDGSWVVTGRFEHAVGFPANGDDARGAWLESHGEMDAFIARHDAEGHVAWVFQAGGTGSDYGEDVEGLPDGGCLVVGHFEGTARFGPDAPDVRLVGSAGGIDAFLVRLRPDGTLAWVRRFGGPGEDSARGVAVSADGKILVTGRFEGTLELGGGALLRSAGKRDAYLACFREDGNLLWARRMGGSGPDEAEDVAVLPDGSALVAGNFEGRLTFGDEVASRLQSAGESDAFLARVSPAGEPVWLASAGGREEDGARGVAAFADGSAVLTGRFDGEARFGAAADAIRLVDAGKNDAFVARYDADGALLWARRAGGVESDYGRAVCPGPDDSCTVTGYFRDVAVFGAGEPGETQLRSSGGLDLFVARWSADGALLWAFSAGEIGPERGYAISALPDGGCLTTGSRPLGQQNLQEADDLLVVRVDARGAGTVLSTPTGGSP